LLTSLQIRLYRVEEFKWERISLVDVWNIAVETSRGVIVCKKADVLELPSEDWQ
jgi:hypothetical protein